MHAAADIFSCACCSLLFVVTFFMVDGGGWWFTGVSLFYPKQQFKTQFQGLAKGSFKTPKALENSSFFEGCGLRRHFMCMFFPETASTTKSLATLPGRTTHTYTRANLVLNRGVVGGRGGGGLDVRRTRRGQSSIPTMVS